MCAGKIPAGLSSPMPLAPSRSGRRGLAEDAIDAKAEAAYEKVTSVVI